MKLPNGERADVPLVRLTSYLLNPAHPTGKHKARVFAAALGLGAVDAPALQNWLRALAREGEAIAGAQDVYGQGSPSPENSYIMGVKRWFAQRGSFAQEAALQSF